MILYYFSLKMEGNKIKSLAKSQYDTLLLADIFGKATDGRFQGISLQDTIAMAKYFNIGGVGGYSTFVHLDSGNTRNWGSAR